MLRHMQEPRQSWLVGALQRAQGTLPPLQQWLHPGGGTVHVILPGQILQKQAAVGMLSLLLLDTSTAGQAQNQPPSPAL